MRPGDKVLVGHCTYITLYQQTFPHTEVGLHGHVVRTWRRYDWEREDSIALLHFLVEDGARSYQKSFPLKVLTLAEPGDGRFEAGVTVPFSAQELRDQRYAAFIHKLMSVDQSHAGFSTPATFLAWLYITNDRRALEGALRLRRKDGTINPDRLRKLFIECRLRIDDWATAPALEFPAEFEHLTNRFRRAPDWAEVAEQFTPSNHD